MIRSLIIAALLGGATTAAAAPASVFIDFTDRSIWNGGGASGNPAVTSFDYGPLTVDLSSNPADRINLNQAFDGKNPTTPGFADFCGPILKCEGDGLGVITDEVAAVDLLATPPRESVTLSFSKGVKIKELYFLDIYTDQPASGGSVNFEQANVYVDGAGPASSMMFQAVEDFQNNAGFLGVDGLSIVATTSATFFASSFPNNDGVGRPDFALAGLAVEVVPLPASVLLLGGALAGFGLLRRRGAQAA
jgi:hypothetical protein